MAINEDPYIDDEAAALIKTEEQYTRLLFAGGGYAAIFQNHDPDSGTGWRDWLVGMVEELPPRFLPILERVTWDPTMQGVAGDLARQHLDAVMQGTCRICSNDHDAEVCGRAHAHLRGGE
jgi:hypothetical protein